MVPVVPCCHTVVVPVIYLYTGSAVHTSHSYYCHRALPGRHRRLCGSQVGAKMAQPGTGREDGHRKVGQKGASEIVNHQVRALRRVQSCGGRRTPSGERGRPSPLWVKLLHFVTPWGCICQAERYVRQGEPCLRPPPLSQSPLSQAPPPPGLGRAGGVILGAPGGGEKNLSLSPLRISLQPLQTRDDGVFSTCTCQVSYTTTSSRVIYRDRYTNSTNVYQEPNTTGVYQDPNTTTRVYQNPQNTTRVYQDPKTTARVYQDPNTTSRVYQNPNTPTRVYQDPKTTTRVYQDPHTTTWVYQVPYTTHTTGRVYQDPHTITRVYQDPYTTTIVYQDTYYKAYIAVGPPGSRDGICLSVSRGVSCSSSGPLYVITQVVGVVRERSTSRPTYTTTIPGSAVRVRHSRGTQPHHYPCDCDRILHLKQGCRHIGWIIRNTGHGSLPRGTVVIICIPHRMRYGGRHHGRLPQVGGVHGNHPINHTSSTSKVAHLENLLLSPSSARKLSSTGSSRLILKPQSYLELLARHGELEDTSSYVELLSFRGGGGRSSSGSSNTHRGVVSAKRGGRSVISGKKMVTFGGVHLAGSAMEEAEADGDPAEKDPVFGRLDCNDNTPVLVPKLEPVVSSHFFVIFYIYLPDLL